MYRLFTEPDKYTQIAELVKTHVRASETDPLFQQLLDRLNGSEGIVTMASSIGHPFTKGKQLIYIHMAITKEGADRIVSLYSKALKTICTDWENGTQPDGVAVKPSALQVRFSYYNYQNIWHQAMVLECRGMHTFAAQLYILNVLNNSL